MATDHTPWPRPPAHGASRRGRRAILPAVPALPIVALFGPTGVGKTAVAIALADLLRAEGEDPVAVSADALQLYRGLEILTGAATAAERARLEHRLVGVLPVTARATAGDYARRAHAEIDGAARRGPAADRRRRHRPLPARRAHRPRPAPAARPAVRARYARRLAAEGAPALHAELAARDPRGRRRDRADRRPARRARARAARCRRAPPPGGAAALDRRDPPSDAARRAHDGARRAVRAHRRARGGDGRRRGGARGARAPTQQARRRPRARRSGSRSSCAATSRRCSGAPAATPSASSPGCASCPARRRSTSPARDAQAVAEEVRSALRVAADSSSAPMKRENGPTTAQ